MVTGVGSVAALLHKFQGRMWWALRSALGSDLMSMAPLRMSVLASVRTTVRELDLTPGNMIG